MTLAALAAVTVWMVLILPAIFVFFNLACLEPCPDVTVTDDVVFLFGPSRLQPETQESGFHEKTRFSIFCNRAGICRAERLMEGRGAAVSSPRVMSAFHG